MGVLAMASLRKANAYSKKKALPFTRVSKKRKKSFIRTVPQQKIVKFEMGNSILFHNKKLPYILILSSSEAAQLRHNALEACRQFINKKLNKALSEQYFFKVIPYPHHIQRENKMLTGAGSDRMQTGMKLSYGKSAGKAALVKKGTKIFLVATANEKGVKLTRKIYKQISSKLPFKTKILYEEIKKEN